VIKGTKVKEISRERLMAERDIIANAPLDDIKGVRKQIKALSEKPKGNAGKKRHATNLVKEYLETI
jgi:hypothetical protein